MNDDLSIEPVRKAVEVGCTVDEAFRIFTEDIDSWWPLATHSIGLSEADACFIEGREGGRIYESHRDGSIHLWGLVTAWDPPTRLVFSWHPGRDAATAQEVELRFSKVEGGSRVEIEHRGWEVLGDKAAETRDNYDTGWTLVLERYVDRCA
jgi:uncharacterized protein YndB with AHSA1/START domain